MCPTLMVTKITVLAALLALLGLLSACGGEGNDDSVEPVTVGDLASLKRDARGQTVRWWMFGGDERINSYVDDEVAPEAERLGIEIERVPVSDTANAVQRVISQRRAGVEGSGAVDLIWINGENFAAGKEAGLWLEDWSRDLPNAELVDFEDPTINRDLQVPIEGQESPWSRAAFVYAYDSARIDAPPSDFDGLLEFARTNPGRFTYPALPDFTGTSFVKQVVATMGGAAAFDYLAELKPLLWEEGDKFPRSEAELNELFANDQVDIAMSFDPSFIASAVRKGDFPRSSRPFLLEGGALVNTSYVTIPADSKNREGALLLANLLLDPELQAIKADPSVLGIPSVLELERLEPDQRRAFEMFDDSPFLLDDFGETTEELPADQVAPLEERWKREILR